jgi:hypothetical protein
MVKAPTKHGLDRKFKSWRKGKSQKANKRSSLKQQLRGHERLMAKIGRGEKDEDKVKTQELKAKIDALKAEIDTKQHSLLEKKHAEKAHGQRFLDRQRLTRQEKQVRKNSAENQEDLLFKLALDEVYVGHHPMDVKYMPLFQKGQRVVDYQRQLYRRAITRKRILKDVHKYTPKTWIAKDQYERLPKYVDWTIQDEERIFGGSMSRNPKETKALQSDDSRFASASNHDAVLEAAKQVESQLDEKEKEEDSDSNSDSSSDASGHDVDKLKPVTLKRKEPAEEAKNDSESDSSSDSDDDDDDVDKLTQKEAKVGNSTGEQKIPNSTSSSDDDSDDDDDDKVTQSKTQSKEDDNSDDDSSSSSSSSDSDSSDEEKEVVKVEPQTKAAESDEEVVDDFLMDADDDADDVFQKTTEQLPAFGAFRGDKSKGWETQQQRPGQFKKRRTRS